MSSGKPVSSGALSNHCGSCKKKGSRQESTLPVIELGLCSSGPIVSERVLVQLYDQVLIMLLTEEVGAQLKGVGGGGGERLYFQNSIICHHNSHPWLARTSSFLIWKHP